MNIQRIYGMKNKTPFCHFPKGKHTMAEIKLQVYQKKKIKTYYGKNLKANGATWVFSIGDISCKIYKHKNGKYRVNDEDNHIFKHCQLAGAFYVQYFKSLNEDFDSFVDREHSRLRDASAPPYRAFDNYVLSLMNESSFVSDRTGQCARNREYICALLNEEYALRDYEVVARNNIIEGHCNSWKNRFGEKYSRHIKRLKFLKLN